MLFAIASTDSKSPWETTAKPASRVSDPQFFQLLGKLKLLPVIHGAAGMSPSAEWYRKSQPVSSFSKHLFYIAAFQMFAWNASFRGCPARWRKRRLSISLTP
jgi:hypothetical protein